VLADVLSREGAQLSVSAILQRNLADAHHLAVLHAIWRAETTAARQHRYREIVTAALPPGHWRLVAKRIRPEPRYGRRECVIEDGPDHDGLVRSAVPGAGPPCAAASREMPCSLHDARDEHLPPPIGLLRSP